MRHFIYRDRTRPELGILIACDAEDRAAADYEFWIRLGFDPTGNVDVLAEDRDIVPGAGGSCVLPHTVGDRYLIRPAPDKKPKSISLAPSRIPGISLFPGVTPRQFHTTCFYCGKMIEGNLRTRDHVTPKSRGGTLKVPCCSPCNRKKGSLTLEEYRVIVAYRNGLIPLDILQQIKFKGEELMTFILPECLHVKE